MPWKNGGGRTLEVAVDPPGATLAGGFRWRLSSAEVHGSGPFSRFPGVARWLFLLEGEGFHLDFGPRGRVSLLEPFQGVTFPGDWPAAATLAGSPCRDLNLMVDAHSVRAAVALVSPAGEEVPLGAETTLLLVLQGSASVPSLGLELGLGHLLRIQGGHGGLAIAPGVAGARLLWAGLDSA